MTQSEKQKIIEMQKQGLKYPTIAKLTGINIGTVKTYCRRHPVDASDTQPGTVAFCKECGKPVVVREKCKPRQFCSDVCRMKWWNGHRDEVKHKTESRFICEFCGGAFTRPGKTRHRVCSKKCSAEARKKAAK